MDYNASDDGYKESPTKECPECFGRKYLKSGFAVVQSGGLIYVPTFRKCKVCYGEGFIYLTIDEIQDEEDAARDNEADLRED